MKVTLPALGFALAYLAGAIDGPLWLRVIVSLLALAGHTALWMLSRWSPAFLEIEEDD